MNRSTTNVVASAVIVAPIIWVLGIIVLEAASNGMIVACLGLFALFFAFIVTALGVQLWWGPVIWIIGAAVTAWFFLEAFALPQTNTFESRHAKELGDVAQIMFGSMAVIVVALRCMTPRPVEKCIDTVTETRLGKVIVIVAVILVVLGQIWLIQRGVAGSVPDY